MNGNFALPQPTAVVPGNFDGLHTGHMELINTMKTAAKAKGLKTAVVSFFPHPMVFFGKSPELKCLLVCDEKKLLLKESGIDYFVELPFDRKLVELSPVGFFDTVLVQMLNCREFVIGEDFCFGKNRAGNAETARNICTEKMIGLSVVKARKCDTADEKVSSTLIRELIQAKKVEQANGLLGYKYFACGEVEAAETSGGNLFTVLTVAVDERKLLPPQGAYSAEIAVGAKVFRCVVTIEGSIVRVCLDMKIVIENGVRVKVRFLAEL